MIWGLFSLNAIVRSFSSTWWCTSASLVTWLPLQSWRSYGQISQNLDRRELFTLVLRTQLWACFVIVCRRAMVSNSISICWSNPSWQLNGLVNVSGAWKETAVSWPRMETPFTVLKTSRSRILELNQFRLVFLFVDTTRKEVTTVFVVIEEICNNCVKTEVSSERDGCRWKACFNRAALEESSVDSIRCKSDWETLLIILIGSVSTLLLFTKNGRASIKAAESWGVRFSLIPAASFRALF